MAEISILCFAYGHEMETEREASGDRLISPGSYKPYLFAVDVEAEISFQY